MFQEPGTRDAVGETPTGAVETTALPKNSPRIAAF
jgi:hypothetical protein